MGAAVRFGVARFGGSLGGTGAGGKLGGGSWVWFACEKRMARARGLSSAPSSSFFMPSMPCPPAAQAATRARADPPRASLYTISPDCLNSARSLARSRAVRSGGVRGLAFFLSTALLSADGSVRAAHYSAVQISFVIDIDSAFICRSCLKHVEQYLPEGPTTFQNNTPRVSCGS